MEAHLNAIRGGQHHYYQYETMHILGTLELYRYDGTPRKIEGGYDNKYRKLRGIGEYTNKSKQVSSKLQSGNVDGSVRSGLGENKKENIPSPNRSAFNQEKYKFFLEAPFEISNKCCNVMKKAPVHKYSKETGRKPFIATMASESRLRTQKWLQNGCNGFDMKSPVSTPMSFWTEQDVLLYIKQNNLQICSVYGDIVEDTKGEEVAGQMTISDIKGFEDYGIFDAERPMLKTTGCKRTGCVACLFGIHLEKEPNRLQMLKESHPKLYEWALYQVKNNGVCMKEAIDWINENSNLDIKY